MNVNDNRKNEFQEKSKDISTAPSKITETRERSSPKMTLA